MAAAEKKNEEKKIGDEAVKKATGKEWKEWYDLIDKAGGKRMNHQEIVAVVAQQFGMGLWWQQMVTVQYEMDRGLREKHQTPDGYQISRSKTINAPAAVLFDAFTKTAVRRKWLKDLNLKFTSSSAGKALRGKFKETIAIDVNFYQKGTDKTQVVVQNNKIKSSAEAERLKAYWEKALLKLGEITSK